MIDFNNFVIVFNKIFAEKFRNISLDELTEEFAAYYKVFSRLDLMDPLQINMEIFYRRIVPGLKDLGLDIVSTYSQKLEEEHLRKFLPEDVVIKEKDFREGFIDDYSIVRMLGEGAFGKVYEVKDKKGKTYAIKEIYYADGIRSWDAESDITNEIELLKKASKIKPKITAPFNKAFVSHDLKNLYLVIDYVNCGTLEDWTKTHELTEKDIAELKRMVKTLHKHKIYHRDLHLENIMVQCDKNGDPIFLLSDFGLSRMQSQLVERNYEWISNLGSDNTAIKRRIRHTTPSDMIKELILYYILINNRIRLI